MTPLFAANFETALCQIMVADFNAENPLIIEIQNSSKSEIVERSILALFRAAGIEAEVDSFSIAQHFDRWTLRLTTLEQVQALARIHSEFRTSFGDVTILAAQTPVVAPTASATAENPLLAFRFSTEPNPSQATSIEELFKKYIREPSMKQILFKTHFGYLLGNITGITDAEDLFYALLMRNRRISEALVRQYPHIQNEFEFIKNAWLELSQRTYEVLSNDSYKYGKFDGRIPKLIRDLLLLAVIERNLGKITIGQEILTERVSKALSISRDSIEKLSLTRVAKSDLQSRLEANPGKARQVLAQYYLDLQFDAAKYVEYPYLVGVDVYEKHAALLGSFDGGDVGSVLHSLKIAGIENLEVQRPKDGIITITGTLKRNLYSDPEKLFRGNAFIRRIRLSAPFSQHESPFVEVPKLPVTILHKDTADSTRDEISKQLKESGIQYLVSTLQFQGPKTFYRIEGTISADLVSEELLRKIFGMSNEIYDVQIRVGQNGDSAVQFGARVESRVR